MIPVDEDSQSDTTFVAVTNQLMNDQSMPCAEHTSGGRVSESSSRLNCMSQEEMGSGAVEKNTISDVISKCPCQWTYLSVRDDGYPHY